MLSENTKKEMDHLNNKRDSDYLLDLPEDQKKTDKN